MVARLLVQCLLSRADLNSNYSSTQVPKKLCNAVFRDGGQPCRFIDHPDGCRNGYECNFCHFRDHDASSAKTHRPSKGVRSGYKRSVNQVIHSDMSEEQKLEAYKKLAERSPYMRCLLRAVVPNIDDLLEEQGHVEAASSKAADQPRAPGLQPAAQMPRTPGQQGASGSKLSL